MIPLFINAVLRAARGFYVRAFVGGITPSLRRVSLRSHIGHLLRRDLHPLGGCCCRLHLQGRTGNFPWLVRVNQLAL